MKVVGKYIRSLYDSNGDLEITFKVNRYNARGLDLSEDADYRLDINLVKQKRSLEQNKLLWSLLNALEIVTREDSWSWYCKALEDTNIHFEYSSIAFLHICSNSLYSSKKYNYHND